MSGTVLRLSNWDHTEMMDLWAGAVRVINFSWNPQGASPQQEITQTGYGASQTFAGYGTVMETMDIAAFGSPSSVRDKYARLEKLFQKALRHGNESTAEDSVWLEWASEGEEVRRTLILGGSWQPQVAPGAWAMIREGKILARMTVMRHPLWERATHYAIADAVPLVKSTIGGVVTVTGMPGRTGARMCPIIFSVETAGRNFTRLWAGFRQEGAGTTGFVSRWECEEVAHGGHGNFTGCVDTATVDDATAGYPANCSSNGHFARTTFADGDLDKRLYITTLAVQPTSTLIEHLKGSYLALLRCKVNDGAAWAQMRWGYALESTSELVRVNWDDYAFLELGTITVPPPGPLHAQWFTAAGLINAAILGIWAQRDATDPATTLDMDCVVLIPTDHLVHLKNTYLNDSWAQAIVTTENDRVHTLGTNAIGQALDVSQVQPQDWYIPNGNSILVMAVDGDDAWLATDELNVWVYAYPRYTLYAEGSETAPTAA